MPPAAPATLAQMLRCREARAARQADCLARYGGPAVSFTMNIPGPVKDSPLIRRAFLWGCGRFEALMAAEKLPFSRVHRQLAPTGCEALYAVAADARRLKVLCLQLEGLPRIGRLFDFDVLPPGGRPLGRRQLGYPPRPCLVCGRVDGQCAARRLHPPQVLSRAARGRMESFFAREDARRAAALAVRSLLYEVCVTPKPGLVDRANSGSHRDMDIFTFANGISVLFPYFEQCVRLGQQGARRPPAVVFARARAAGRRAEQAMFAATGGVNTHKGAIFLLGTLCTAYGRLWRPWQASPRPGALLEEGGALCIRAVRQDWRAARAHGARTAGQRLYLQAGMPGARGEMARGLPAVRRVALPALEAALAAGLGPNDAGAIALVHLIAQVQDTNVAARSSPGTQRAYAARARALLARSPLPPLEEIARLDRAFIRANLSPGGCADLLAAAFFVHFLCREDAAAAGASPP